MKFLSSKKILVFIALIAVSFSGFAEADRILRFDAGVCSGYPFYGDQQISESNDTFNNGVYNRFFIGPVINLSFKISKPFKFVLGADTLFDLVWNGSLYNNHFDYACYGGVKFYPGLKGFNAGVYYAGGQRLDYCNQSDVAPLFNATSWGNGFRISLEYDFLYESSSEVMPVLGVYYRFMPRGYYTYDNILAFYIMLAY